MSADRLRLLAFTVRRGKDGSTLRGFADIEIPILELTIPDVPVHSQNGKHWAQIPGKAQTNGDQVVRKPNGKIAYVPCFRFSERMRRAFCGRVVELVNEAHPEALP